ncbi:hypothetical protein ACQ4M3_01230 [Leptolyngbya sp. AN03gr2]|uniref:hypothetical protein n=1 Tax=unclassified Leptolyngbya TaxID=2650499 RepID=UPI003D3120B1
MNTLHWVVVQVACEAKEEARRFLMQLIPEIEIEDAEEADSAVFGTAIEVHLDLNEEQLQKLCDRPNDIEYDYQPIDWEENNPYASQLQALLY